MRIAACDDDAKQLSRLGELLNEYKNSSGTEVSAALFGSGIDLLASMDKNIYDLLILDILMPGFTGMEAAKEIRLKNEEIKIVFLTSSPEFAVESYRVHAYDYLMKPVNRKDLFALLDTIAKDTSPEQEVLVVESNRTKIAIPFSKLEYLEIINRTLVFHMADGSTKETFGKLSDYEDLLTSRPEFSKIHRSFIVNMRYIRTIDRKVCSMSGGSELPVARASAKETVDAYMNFMFSMSGPAKQ